MIPFIRGNMHRLYSVNICLKPRILAVALLLITCSPFENERGKILFTRQTDYRNLKSIRLRWAGHVARMELYINAYRVLLETPEGKRHLGSLAVDREDNIKII